jgi:quercetin dioxygenase-like cupin family protein
VKVTDAEIDARVGERIDLFGPSVEFLTQTSNANGAFCVLRGVIPPGVSVPLHSHADIEDFYVISGEALALRQGAQRYETTAHKTGDYVRVPSGVRHGWRNVSSEPFVSLIITTPTLGKFFLEAGRPVEQASQPPTSDDFARLANTSAKYGYWNAGSEENAAVGIAV